MPKLGDWNPQTLVLHAAINSPMPHLPFSTEYRQNTLPQDVKNENISVLTIPLEESSRKSNRWFSKEFVRRKLAVIIQALYLFDDIPLAVLAVLMD